MDNSHIYDIITAIIGSGVISTIINQICYVINQRRDEKNGIKGGLRIVLKDRLRFLCTHYIAQGWIYEDELEDLVQMHDSYHGGLGGNGYLDDLMNRVKNLEIRGIGIK